MSRRKILLIAIVGTSLVCAGGADNDTLNGAIGNDV